MEPTLDQYGEVVPELADIPAWEDLNDFEVELVMELPWYEVNKGHGIKRLCAPAELLDYYEYICEIWPGDTVARVTDNLKRANPIDGFYHA